MKCFTFLLCTSVTQRISNFTSDLDFKVTVIQTCQSFLIDAPVLWIWKSCVALISSYHDHAGRPPVYRCQGNNNTPSVFYGWRVKMAPGPKELMQYSHWTPWIKAGSHLVWLKIYCEGAQREKLQGKLLISKYLWITICLHNQASKVVSLVTPPLTVF